MENDAEVLTPFPRKAAVVLGGMLSVPSPANNENIRSDFINSEQHPSWLVAIDHRMHVDNAICDNITNRHFF